MVGSEITTKKIFQEMDNDMPAIIDKWNLEKEQAEAQWSKQEREAQNDSKLGIVRMEVENTPGSAQVAAMSPAGSEREELFVVVANETRSLRYSRSNGLLQVEAPVLPMHAFPQQEALSLNQGEKVPGSESTVIEIDTQIKYLNNRNLIQLVPVENSEGMISIDDLEKRLASLEQSGEIVSAEYLSAVYRLKLEQQRSQIEAAIAEKGAPTVDLDRIPGNLKTEADKQWLRRDPEDGELRGDEWLWIEKQGNRDVVMFKNEESLSVIWDKKSQNFIFNIEAAPAQAYQKALILNGGADENKISKKLTVSKEAAEEHGLKVLEVIELGKVVANPNRLHGASNMHIAIAEYQPNVKEIDGKDADEITDIFPGAFSREEVQWLILQGKITDARTIAGFYLAEIYLNNNPSFLQ